MKTIIALLVFVSSILGATMAYSQSDRSKAKTISDLIVDKSRSPSYQSRLGVDYWECRTALSEDVIRIIGAEMNAVAKANNQRGVDLGICYVGKAKIFGFGEREFDTVDMYPDAIEFRKWRSGQSAANRNVFFLPFKNGTLMRSYTLIGEEGQGFFGGCFDEKGNNLSLEKNCVRL
jgi:hypothetical protein